MKQVPVDWWQSLRTKALLQAVLLSTPLLLFGFLTVRQTRNAATQIDRIFNQNAAVSKTAREAFVKLAEARYHASNNDPASFQQSADDFDLLMKAIAWGTDSEVFLHDNDGELKKRWSEAGWQDTIGDVSPSERTRQDAAEIALYYRGFSKYMTQVMTLSDPLGLLNDPVVNDAQKKASKYERLVVQDLRGLLNELSRDTYDRRAAMVALQFHQMHRSFLLAVALFFLVMASTWFLSMKDVVRPIIRLTAEVEKMRAGNLASRLAPRSHDEIGQLTRSFNQMTEQLQKVSVSRDYMNAVLEASPLGLILTDAKGITRYSNRAFLNIVGVEEDSTDGKGWGHLLHPEDHDRVMRDWTLAVSKAQSFLSEHRFLRGKTAVWTRVVAAPMFEEGKLTGYVASIEDITDQTNLENAVRQSEKMAAVGQLAGGIAHDLNNGLTPVMGYLDLLLLDASEQAAAILNEAKQSTQRCADVVRQLLNFSRPMAQAKEVLPVARLCAEFRRLAHTILPPTIVVKIECAPDAGSVEASETDLMNVLMNLALNAKDAMRSRGSLTVTASRASAGAGKLSEIDRPHVLISVTDTGEGIPPDVVDRIFEPFFTTKPKGKGTGLGLAMVYNTVEEHGGRIEVSSVLGTGTTFQVYLPLSEKGGAAGFSEPEDISGLPHGEGLVLLVDDEEALRNMGKKFLERVGYRVVLAEDGTQAVEIFSKRSDEIRAVVMDITMPKISGIEAMKKMLAIDPKVPILLLSGYTSEGTPQELVKAGAAAFLAKPFTIAPLARTLHRILAERSPRG